MRFLPDPFKIDVIKFLDSAPGKAFVEVLKARCPAAPEASLPHSTKLSMYDQRAGAEEMISLMLRIPRESDEPTKDADAERRKREAILLDPRN